MRHLAQHGRSCSVVVAQPTFKAPPMSLAEQLLDIETRPRRGAALLRPYRGDVTISRRFA